MKDDGRHRDTGLLTAVRPHRWTPAVFGVVPAGARRRRPSDILRVAGAAIVVTITALGADELGELDKKTFEFLDAFPSWWHSGAEVVYRAAAAGTMLVLLAAMLGARRLNLFALFTGAGLLAWVIAVGLRDAVDAQPERVAAGLTAHGNTPEYPVVALAVVTTVLLVAGPYLVRPARRIVVALLVVSSFAAAFALIGLPDDIAASLALGWGVAAMFHLVVGTPAATPALDHVQQALDDIGVAVTDLRLAEAQVWGETRFLASAPDGTGVSIDVIGRDAADAHLFAKAWRFLWYKDSGPDLAFSRTQQLEHRAYLLLLAERAGIPVSDVVIAGVGGPRELAVLVLHEPGGRPLTEIDRVTISDALLDEVWRNVNELHAARLAHGQLRAANIRVDDDDQVAIVDFAHASATAPQDRRTRDAVELLVTTAELVGVERALESAYRSSGRDGLAELLPMLEFQALSAATRAELHGNKELLKSLREKGAQLAGEESVELVKLRRISAGDILLAAGAILGVYLLIGQLAGIDFSTTFDGAAWGWVAIAFLISLLPPFTGGIALMGSVSIPLPYKPVVAEQFANNFTGLIGGTVANTALVIRFFQKQGQKVAVAASSGVLNSLAGGIVQVVLVIVGLIVTGSEFTPSDSGGKDAAQLVIIIIVIAAFAVSAALFIPRLRRRLRKIVGPQWQAAQENLRGILTAPRKAAMLFGGNLATQVVFALVLEAALHAYGYSLPLFQMIVVNSLASVIGGMAPVPGGMGVVEAGLIAGLTAAGIPQTEAVATTFTARLFTAYLSPIWGWFALRWLQRNDYV